MQFVVRKLEKFSQPERDQIDHALRIAESAHASQRRVAGAPYITHPIAVAECLITEFNADADTVIAGLLHDTVEDTQLTLDDIEREFGSTIRFLVDGATDVGKGDGNAMIEDRTERDAATHRKVAEFAAKDSRLYLVKIADRWHNMLNCDVLRTKNQKRLAKETLEFHVPWATQLGFAEQAQELRNVSEGVLNRIERLEHDGARNRRYRM